MTLIGRHDNAFANLRNGAEAGRKNGAIGYLNTDWGDGGHPQPLAVSYLPYLVGAGLSWCADSFDESLLAPVLSRDVFHDPTQRLARAALGLGLAHRKFKYYAPNLTPFEAVIAAPPPRLRELVCRDGLKYYARIPEKNIRAALEEVEKQRAVLYRGLPKSNARVWKPDELHDVDVLGKVLEHMQAAQRGLRRLAEALEDTGPEGSTPSCSR